MAIRLLRPEEFGNRVKEVRRRLGMGSVELSLALGQDKQYISRLEKAQRKRVDRSEKVLLAEFAEGKADFSQTNAPEILHFLEGEIDWQVSLVPSIAPRGDGGADLNSHGPQSDLGGYPTPFTRGRDVIPLRRTGT